MRVECVGPGALCAFVKMFSVSVKLNINTPIEQLWTLFNVDISQLEGVNTQQGAFLQVLFLPIDLLPWYQQGGQE